MTMRALPAKLKFAAYAYSAMALWIVLLMIDTEQSAPLLPLLVLIAGSPAIGWGLRRVKRWAYIALVVHAPTVVAIGVIALAYVSRDAIGAVVHATVLLGYFLRPDVRLPYLAQQKRGFRGYKRFATNLRTVVEAPSGKHWGETLDISAGGVYVHTDPTSLPIDTRVIVEIQLRDTQRLRVPSRVVSANLEAVASKPYGVALQFTSLTQEERSQLQEFISIARRHERIVLQLPVTVVSNAHRIAACTADLSPTGCYLALDAALLQPGDRTTLELALHDGDILEVAAEVIWLSFQGAEGKPPGAAFHFTQLAKVDSTRLRERLKEAGA